MYIFPEIGHNSVKNLLITLHCEATIYEEHLLTSVVILYQGRLKKVHMSKWTINDFPNNMVPTLNQNVNIPNFPQKCITERICTRRGCHTSLAPPFRSVTGNKGTV